MTSEINQHLIEPVQLSPIGVIRSPYQEKYSAPRQPGVEVGEQTGVIELIPGVQPGTSLRDLAGFSHLWVISWFHQAEGWNPMVKPPRGSSVKRGVFATRSPHRPNPIGLSLVKIISIRKNRITVSGIDLLDGTPVLDIKPYLPAVEAKPDATSGWISPLSNEDTSRVFTVAWSLMALRQLSWLEQHGITGFRARALLVLSTDPFPHPYKRIRQQADGSLVMAWKDWRLSFLRQEQTIQVQKVFSGYAQTPKPDLHRQFEMEFIGMDD